MNATKLFLLSIASSTLLYLPATQAESIIDGIYMSAGDAQGLAKCTLTVRSVDEEHKYGDEVFDLESSGDGSCEWSAMGISKSGAISGGMVTNAGATAFIKLTFPFGPAGKRVDVTMYELDGELRQEDTFNKESDLVANN